jgi:hypothetical protein
MTEFTLGDAPIEAQYIEMMTTLAHGIDEFFNGDQHGNERSTGFVLLVFPFGLKDGRCNFLSNGANREDIVVLMREMIARFEGMPAAQGHA